MARFGTPEHSSDLPIWVLNNASDPALGDAPSGLTWAACYGRRKCGALSSARSSVVAGSAVVTAVAGPSDSTLGVDDPRYGLARLVYTKCLSVVSGPWEGVTGD